MPSHKVQNVGLQRYPRKVPLSGRTVRPTSGYPWTRVPQMTELIRYIQMRSDAFSPSPECRPTNVGLPKKEQKAAVAAAAAVVAAAAAAAVPWLQPIRFFFSSYYVTSLR